ncbi:MAG: UDP-N-acetylmuramoyl-L-alanine--D-glutamate ligase [Planctomycetaceae bacterium]|nr:UDP-N-acetylmuramoyl-L-alanine--D-glutamate ligase [Planctomycetaceae bacterium]
MDLAGRRVTVMGLGRHGGGVGAVRFLAAQGARVTVTDRLSADLLSESLSELDDCPGITWHLGGHAERAFRDAELIVVNPAVRPDDPWLVAAAAAGSELTTEIELFLARAPARVAAVTGSNGKSSTAAMLASILEAAGRRVWLGGNIGRSLLGALDRMRPDDAVVLELSSFQLQRLRPTGRGIDLAVITNCVPNHLDWHGTFAAYCAAKQQLLRLQPADSFAVLNVADPVVATWRHEVRGQLQPACPATKIPSLAIAGQHQRENASLAAAAAEAWGADGAAIETGLQRFAGLPHRLERIGEIGGREFYNDSLATTPESTRAALQAFDRPIWLLAGGYDKGADFDELVRAIAARASGVAFYGAVGDRLQAALERLPTPCGSTRVPTLREALGWCWSQSRPGDVILLSPACASYDQFRDYADRAEQFRRAAAQLATKPCLL